MQPKRVRHHTNDEGLRGIQRTGAIKPARGDVGFAVGIHVEVEPFGTTRPGQDGPLAQLASAGEGAYVEFDAPPSMIRTNVGPRNTGLIRTTEDEPYPLQGLNPFYVRVRWYKIQFWRKRWE